MGKLIRIDKLLAEMSIGTRAEVKNYIKKGRVCINGTPIKAADTKVDIEQDIIAFDQSIIHYVTHEYYMLNKPADVVSATRDNRDETVLDLLFDAKRKDLFPVGRLDKDTEGLLLITNDGALSHQLLSPKKHVSKVYYAKISGAVTDEDVIAFKSGVNIEDEFTTLPAELKILKSGTISEIELTIYEGKFHQVKRMFEAVGKQVIYLKRLSMGPLVLDPNLKPGEYRALTTNELELLKQETKDRS